MGIHNLLKYIRTDGNVNLTQCESGKNIYISNIIYFDVTYKLIEIYNKFITSNVSLIPNQYDMDTKINELLKFVEVELTNMFIRLKNLNRVIYVFVDYKFMNKLKECNVLFKDFLNINIDEHERVNSIPMIKRKYVKLLVILYLEYLLQL